MRKKKAIVWLTRHFKSSVSCRQVQQMARKASSSLKLRQKSFVNWYLSSGMGRTNSYTRSLASYLTRYVLRLLSILTSSAFQRHLMRGSHTNESFRIYCAISSPVLIKEVGPIAKKCDSLFQNVSSRRLRELQQQKIFSLARYSISYSMSCVITTKPKTTSTSYSRTFLRKESISTSSRSWLAQKPRVCSRRIIGGTSSHNRCIQCQSPIGRLPSKAAFNMRSRRYKKAKRVLRDSQWPHSLSTSGMSSICAIRDRKINALILAVQMLCLAVHQVFEASTILSPTTSSTFAKNSI